MMQIHAEVQPQCRVHYRAAMVAICALTIAGCGSQSNLAHLRAWVAHGATKAAAHHRPITPIPSIPAYHPVPFVGNQRSVNHSTREPGGNPFRSFIIAAPKASAIVAAQPGNPGAPPLQRYSLSSLTMAGVVKKEDGQWMAVFITPKGNVHRAAPGILVGLRGGHLTRIHYSQFGKSFVLVRVPVAMIGGRTVTRTVKIDQH